MHLSFPNKPRFGAGAKGAAVTSPRAEELAAAAALPARRPGEGAAGAALRGDCAAGAGGNGAAEARGAAQILGHGRGGNASALPTGSAQAPSE